MERILQSIQIITDETKIMLPIILYENILRSGSLFASGTAENYLIENIVDYKSFTKWKADGISDPWIECDFLSAKSPDTIGIYNHNFDQIGGTIKIQYDDSGWKDLKILTVNETYPILETFTEQSSSKFRLLFISPSIEPEIGNIFLGSRIDFPVPPDTPGTPAEEGINAAMEISQAGHNLGAIISFFPLKSSVKFSNITRTWFDNNIRPFWFSHARYLLPFFYAFDLDERPDDVYFVTMDKGQTFKEMLTILSLTDELSFNFNGISSDKNYSPLIDS